MKVFSNQVELGISREELINMLEYYLNQNARSPGGTDHTITSLSVHNDAKYVVKIRLGDEG